MKDKREIKIGTREKEVALLDFVNFQAQEAILNPNLPDTYKDEVLATAVGTIQKVAESKAAYYAKYGEGRRTRQPRVIYDAENDYKEPENIPPIITELNENLRKDAPESMQDFSVEWIAERAGINRKILYEWVESDAEFTTALGRLREVQADDPFKTGTDEDFFVNSMTIALLLLETKQRHHEE